MKSYFYDFHIHTCLSPCADDEMTPNNIANLSAMIGLDIIAITDHNTTKNVKSVMCAARYPSGLVVIPGMELETQEEVHVICLFADLEQAERFENAIEPFRIRVKNNPQIFGNQIIMDEHDNKTGEQEDLLLTAVNISLNKACELVHQFNGAFIAAHIDRDSFSVIKNLGFISPDMNFDAVEFSNKEKYCDLIKSQPYLKEYKALFNSDAHRLENISLPQNVISFDCDEILTAEMVINNLKSRAIK